RRDEGAWGGGTLGFGGGVGTGGTGGPGLREEEEQLLAGIKKLLMELNVEDDATQPPNLHTQQKLQRCFGAVLRRPVPGNGWRALQLAQRMQGQRAAVVCRPDFIEPTPGNIDVGDVGWRLTLGVLTRGADFHLQRLSITLRISIVCTYGG
ncbi:hypothetical protein Vafri_12233, partial [Volvox africanus]